MLVMCVRSVVSALITQLSCLSGCGRGRHSVDDFSSVCCVAVIDICRPVSLSSKDVVSTRPMLHAVSSVAVIALTDISSVCVCVRKRETGSD